MTKNDTLAILAMLNAFYAGGKNDPKQQVNAWYLILYKYDFEDAKEAVLNFAENDTRQYATFPAVGLIVNEIRKVMGHRQANVTEVLNSIAYGRTYDSISKDAKCLINENQYNEWLSIKADVFADNIDAYQDILKRRQARLTE